MLDLAMFFFASVGPLLPGVMPLGVFGGVESFLGEIFLDRSDHGVIYSGCMNIDQDIIRISNLNKIYGGDFHALQDVSLSIKKGEIFALLGPNGAGKTTLISTVCGLVTPTSGQVEINGYDIVKQPRKTRSFVGLVPQELTTNAFERVWDSVCFSRGLFGKAANPDYIEEVLKSLSLWDKRHNKMMQLSGGMKRRVLIAKALSHEPEVLFLDEPTAGVDVELRKDMWRQMEALRESGVTIILTTHYIEEAEHMADRVGVINKGKLILVEEKDVLMSKLGVKELTLELCEPLVKIPESLRPYDLEIDGVQCVFRYEVHSGRRGEESSLAHPMEDLLALLRAEGIHFRDLSTKQSSLEDIFVNLVQQS